MLAKRPIRGTDVNSPLRCVLLLWATSPKQLMSICYFNVCGTSSGRMNPDEPCQSFLQWLLSSVWAAIMLLQVHGRKQEDEDDVDATLDKDAPVGCAIVNLNSLECSRCCSLRSTYDKHISNDFAKA